MLENAKCCAMCYLQWYIARHYLGNLVELNIHAAKVSILLPEKWFYTFKYFIKMQVLCCFIPN
jgi:hypothetical protein